MDPEAFKGYLEVFKHGMPPHGGFAIGAERLTALLLGVENVRFARLFLEMKVVCNLKKMNNNTLNKA